MPLNMFCSLRCIASLTGVAFCLMLTAWFLFKRLPYPSYRSGYKVPPSHTLFSSGLKTTEFPSLMRAMSSSEQSGEPPNERYQVVFVTYPESASNGNSSEQFASQIVAEKLVACVNIVSGVKSIYSWGGKIETDQEVLLMMKTKKSALQKLKEFVKKNHPYEVPEVVAMDITDGSKVG
eukprot:GHVQ01015917.1.p1 GENE.GHVQ01015917.1~~GHVQ01015917.1.p1  ORF type:complete len:178 (+),score=16.45 GHVQ01015917.1:38-571(+)